MIDVRNITFGSGGEGEKERFLFGPFSEGAKLSKVVVSARDDMGASQISCAIVLLDGKPSDDDASFAAGRVMTRGLVDVEPPSVQLIIGGEGSAVHEFDLSIVTDTPGRYLGVVLGDIENSTINVRGYVSLTRDEGVKDSGLPDLPKEKREPRPPRVRPVRVVNPEAFD